MKLKNKNSGFAILYTMMIITIAVGISMGVANMVYKERSLSRIGRDSLNARAAADVGMECMLAKDKMPTFFDPTLGSFALTCGRDSSGNPVNYMATLTSTTPSAPPYTSYKYTVDIINPVTGPCFVGYLDRDTSVVPSKTNISVQGYNICSNTNPARVERGILATYDSIAGSGGGGGGGIVDAVGGSVVTIGNYRIHTFASGSGTFDILNSIGGSIEVLIVGGGGGGGGSNNGGAGGGGGGGVEQISSLAVNTNDSFSVSIGSGGAGGIGGSTWNGSKGGDSIFGIYTAEGGGRGAHGVGTGIAGGAGGSGGGGGYGGAMTPFAIGYGGLASGLQGYNGGNATFGAEGGGGGGAGAIGGNSVNGFGGNGGSGLLSSISGAATIYGGGGGGGSWVGVPGSGGGGGAGAGSVRGFNGNSATGYGNGGGGCGGQVGATTLCNGGDGSGGIVIIKYRFQ